MVDVLPHWVNTASHRGWLRVHGGSGHVRSATRYTVIGPLMLLTYINAITHGINLQMRLFVDDALLYYPVRTIEDGASLQHDLHTLHRSWSKSCKMTFNGKKCHVMHFTRNRNRSITSCSYQLGHDKFTAVSHHPCLGVEPREPCPPKHFSSN